MNKLGLIKSFDVNEISHSELFEIGKVQKDMWAYGLGEYVKCNCCNKIHSKNDIFGHLSSEIRRESVTKLEEIYLGDSIKCKSCNGTNTDFIYDVDQNIQTFQDRYKEQAFLVLSYDEVGTIVGFCDGYISDFETIFHNDLILHYQNFNGFEIENNIKEILRSKSLEKMLYFSSLGTYEKYISYSYIYELLRSFFKSILLQQQIPGITELDKNNSLYKIYQMMGSISLKLDKDKVINTGNNYESDICIFPNPIYDFKSKYDVNFRTLVKNHKIK